MRWTAEAPLVLIQDYHFALLPAYVKGGLDRTRGGDLWHIPWPNFEAVGIRPWQSEILRDAGPDLIGFHTSITAITPPRRWSAPSRRRVDWEHFSVTRGQRVTHSPSPSAWRPSLWTFPSASAPRSSPASGCRPSEFLGVGVERGF